MDSPSVPRVPDWSRACIWGGQGVVIPDTGFKSRGTIPILTSTEPEVFTIGHIVREVGEKGLAKGNLMVPMTPTMAMQMRQNGFTDGRQASTVAYVPCRRPETVELARRLGFAWHTVFWRIASPIPLKCGSELLERTIFGLTGAARQPQSPRRAAPPATPQKSPG